MTFGPLHFGNEGYEKTFGLHPGGDGAQLFHYEHKTEYKVALVVTRKKVEFLIDDKLITTGPGISDKVGKFIFSAGDGWSRGKVEYSEIVVSR